MAIFGKKIGDYIRFARTGMILIVLMGIVRFAVGVSGIPYERATHFVSMTILTLILILLYGSTAATKDFGTYRHLLPMAFSLSLTMYAFIAIGILVEGLTGIAGYFHAHTLHALAQNDLVQQMEIDTALDLPSHIAGQFIVMVPFTLLGWGLASVGFLIASRRPQ
ncbi:MAG: hypothetical protein HY646_19320 [Acidobacteria bacterium]|nr:hypothetical protein [Acidobacteriota bacterium]